jgi:mannose-6-phosphate isomerase-like protein (cupin superfamily)
VGRKIRLEHALATDPAPSRLDPRQDSDEFLLVIRGELQVEFDSGPLTAGPGEGILISKGERHRAAVQDDCLLLSVEAEGMKRFEG